MTSVTDSQQDKPASDTGSTQPKPEFSALRDELLGQDFDGQLPSIEELRDFVDHVLNPSSRKNKLFKPRNLSADQKKLAVSLTLLAAAVPRIMLDGYVIKKYWDWFMPADVPRISAAQALGLRGLVYVLVPQPDINKSWDELTKEKTLEERYQPPINQAVFMLHTLLIGRVIKRYI